MQANIRLHRRSPMHTGNRILVAKGNNWIQYGGYIEYREKLTKWNAANRKWICLLPGATKGFQYGRQTWNRGQYSQRSSRQEVEFLSKVTFWESLYKSNVTNKETNKETNTACRDHRSESITGQFRWNIDLYRSV